LKELFKTKIIKKLFKINNNSRKVKPFEDFVRIEKKLLDEIDVNNIIDDSVSQNARRKLFRLISSSSKCQWL
jgi:CRISPR/Cas system CSM-associated protein Csm2 small subunit